MPKIFLVKEQCVRGKSATLKWSYVASLEKRQIEEESLIFGALYELLETLFFRRYNLLLLA